MNPLDQTSPGQRLRQVRGLADMTRKEFGEACRIGSEKAVARRERDEYRITLRDLQGIDAALDWVNVLWVINGEGSPLKTGLGQVRGYQGIPQQQAQGC